MTNMSFRKNHKKHILLRNFSENNVFINPRLGVNRCKTNKISGKGKREWSREKNIEATCAFILKQ